MSGKSGKTVYIDVRTSASGVSPEVWTRAGGARNHSIDLNMGLVDDSDKDSNGWSSRDYLGLKSIKVTQVGLWKGTVGELAILTHINDLTTPKDPIHIKLTEEGIGTWEFDAVVKRDIDAPHDNAKGQTLVFDNQGAVTFTAASPQS